MAELGKIRIIKDNTGGSGIAVDPIGGVTTPTRDGTASSGTASATAGVSADIVKDNTGGSGVTITIVNNVTGLEIVADEPFYKQLCLNEGDMVHYQAISYRKETPFATNVTRITAGTVKSIDDSGNSGTITERKTNVVIPFYHANLEAQKIKAGDDVRYHLVRDSKGSVVATNLREIVD